MLCNIVFAYIEIRSSHISSINFLHYIVQSNLKVLYKGRNFTRPKFIALGRE